MGSDPDQVGDSTTRSGEDIPDQEGGDKEDLGTKGESERPVGGSSARESSGVDPQEPIDPDSPNLPTGG